MRNQARCGVLLVVTLLVGCSGGDTVGPAWEDGPGTNAWNDSDDVDCKTDEDCSAGESCDRRLQMKRCTTGVRLHRAARSAARLRGRRRPGHRRDATPTSTATSRMTAAYIESWDLERQEGARRRCGDFEGKRPTASPWSSRARRRSAAGPTASRLDVGDMSPRRLAAGDTDADGIDELWCSAPRCHRRLRPADDPVPRRHRVRVRSDVTAATSTATATTRPSSW